MSSNNTNTGSDKKRKDISSTSSADSSFDQGKPKGPQGPRVQAARQKQAEKKPKRGSGQKPSDKKQSEKPSDKTQSKLESYIGMEAQLKEITQNMMTEAKMSAILDDKLSVLKTSIMQEINTTIEMLQGDLHEVRAENERLSKDVKDLKEKNERLHEKLFITDRKANLAIDKVDDLEQYGRKSNVRISGLPDNKKDETIDECVTKVVDVLQNKLGVKVENKDISIAHRLGLYDSTRPRPVIVRFISRRHKVEVIRNRRKLKGSKIVIREDLTKRNVELLKTVVSLQEVETAWTREGIVFAKFLDGHIRKITHNMDLSNYQRKIVK